MTKVLVSSDALHELPAGTAPSPTTKVTLTGPTWVHVKEELAVEAFPNVPLGADQSYVMFPGMGPAAVAESVTVPPTLVSVGEADTLLQAAQSKLVPFTRVT